MTNRRLLAENTQVQTINLKSSSELAAAISLCLVEQARHGRTLIVVDRPVIFLSTLRKNWLRVGRKFQRERASSLNPQVVLETTAKLEFIYTVQFSALSRQSDAQIRLVSSDELNQLAMPWQTLILCQDLPLQQMEFLMSYANPNAQVVEYLVLEQV